MTRDQVNSESQSPLAAMKGEITMLIVANSIPKNHAYLQNAGCIKRCSLRPWGRLVATLAVGSPTVRPRGSRGSLPPIEHLSDGNDPLRDHDQRCATSLRRPCLHVNAKPTMIQGELLGKGGGMMPWEDWEDLGITTGLWAGGLAILIGAGWLTRWLCQTLNQGSRTGTLPRGGRWTILGIVLLIVGLLLFSLGLCRASLQRWPI